MGKTAASPRPQKNPATVIHFECDESSRKHRQMPASDKPASATRRSETRFNTSGATPRPMSNPAQKSDGAKTHLPFAIKDVRSTNVAIHPPTDDSMAT